MDGLWPCRLAEKKASIGYTYEDSTVAELENPPEKRAEEEDSEEDSNTDEDEAIPDIGTPGSGVRAQTWEGGASQAVCAKPWGFPGHSHPRLPFHCLQMLKWTWTS